MKSYPSDEPLCKASVITVLLLLMLATGCQQSKEKEEQLEPFDELVKEAENGNAEAQLKLGNAYAQNRLGVLSFTGDGCKQNFAEAVNWFRKSADQGNADALWGLGFCYFSGKGVSQDTEEAKRLWTRAAAQGQPEAQKALNDFKRLEELIKKKQEQLPDTTLYDFNSLFG